MTQQKKPTTGERVEKMRREFEEMQEETLRLVEMSCGQEFERKMEGGAIEDRARERGIPYQDAFREIQDEVYQPLVEANHRQREAAAHATAVRVARELGGEPPPSPEQVRLAEEEEERAELGFSNAEVEAYAKRHGLGYHDAFDRLLEEQATKEAVELEERPSAAYLSEEEDEEIDRRAWVYVRKHGVSYREALDKTMEEGT